MAILCIQEELKGLFSEMIWKWSNSAHWCSLLYHKTY